MQNNSNWLSSQCEAYIGYNTHGDIIYNYLEKK